MDRLPLSSAFYQASKFDHQKMVLQAKPFDFTVPKDIVTAMVKHMQMLLFGRNAHEFRKLSWPALNMSPNLKGKNLSEGVNCRPTVT